MELLFLGTGGGVPAKQRNVTGMALTMPEKKGAVWLFDCGEATQHQILHTKVRLPKVEAIFITHLHGDHLYGLPGLLGSRSFQGATDPITVIGPPGLKQFIEVTLNVSKTYLRYPMEIVELEKEGMCYEDEEMMVEVKELDHGIQCFGYRIIEKDRPGALLVEKLKAMGIKPGPIYRKIKTEEKIMLEDGREIWRKDFVGPTKNGRIITILGDTRPCQNGIELARHADLLVHEATFGEDKAELAHDYFHSSAKQAAKIAKTAEAVALILTHISSRYASLDEAEPLLKEATSIFPCTYLANDFWSYEMPYQPR